MTPDASVSNPFAAADVGVLYDRGRPFHHPRTLVRIVEMVGSDEIDRARDIACETRIVRFLGSITCFRREG